MLRYEQLFIPSIPKDLNELNEQKPSHTDPTPDYSGRLSQADDLMTKEFRGQGYDDSQLKKLLTELLPENY